VIEAVTAKRPAAAKILRALSIFTPTAVLERTMADAFSRPRRIINGSRPPVWCKKNKSR
jgi:hypothetical protein